ncbi:MAG: hypothetical protein ACP5FL_09585 [Thermoplasmatota archaeon]
MDRIPLVYVEQGQATVEGKRFRAVEALKELRGEHDLVYVLDLDGIQHNRANIDVYKKVSKKAFLWLDAAPRRVEDVIDLVVAGAARVTLQDAMHDDDLRQLVDMVENHLYLRSGEPAQAERRIRQFGLAGLVLSDAGRDTWNVETWHVKEEQSIVERIA